MGRSSHFFFAVIVNPLLIILPIILSIPIFVVLKI